jgi:hypothetical protein
MRGMMDGGRSQREKIVYMHDIRLPVYNPLPHTVMSGRTPRGLKPRPHQVPRLDQGIVEDYLVKLMAPCGQGTVLGFPGLVLAPAVPVLVMNHQYLHAHLS